MVAEFLGGETPRSWESERTGAKCELYVGNGSSALEVIVARRDGRPRKDWLRRLYGDRRGSRTNPILVVALRDDGGTADVCGPVGEEPAVRRDLEPAQVERICATALDRPDHHAAQRFLDATLDERDDEVVGLRNRGLLSTRELRVGVPDRPDWDDAAAEARGLLETDGRDLVEGLGYEVERLGDRSYVLADAADARRTAVAVFLRGDESFDRARDRFAGRTPVSYALAEADREDLDYVVASSDGTLRLYTTDPDAGFGSRGRTGTFVEVNTDLLADENAGYLALLFSSDALRDDGSLHEIVADSKEYAAALGRRLRERIYDDVVPDLAEAIAEARDLDDPTRDELDETYRMSLVQLYRLLFVAYAEDEGFLPRHDPRYERRSLKSKARELHDLVRDDVDFDGESTTHWDDVTELSRAVHDGRSEWGLPEYGGRLLSSDPDVSEAGAKLADVELTDDQFGPVLATLLVDETADGYEGPVDFRNVGVREFGAVYEGLLESELSVADRPLAVDDEGRYTPVDADGQQPLGRGADESVVVEEGQVYLHGRSGERKATGTYYTRTRFVGHLLDHSLEPALEEHADRLDRLREEEGREAAADAFFDVRVADISMGSGHFLVGAVDRIERHLLSYLGRDDVALPQVERELDRLRETAEAAFETAEATPEVERSQLLRRQIARRCIYGVDRNDLATELARLSLWVHTFVPGLPLAFLDYNLTTGDSLAGIGTLDEVRDVLDVDQPSPTTVAGGSSVVSDFEDDIERLGRRADADAEEVAEARETREKIDDRLERTRAAFDVLAASRIDDEIDPDVVDDASETRETDEYARARRTLEPIDPLHFPAAFPEVFRRENPGFDVIVGNPPWEEATLEEDEFWTRYEPGLMGRSQTDQERLKEALREERPDLVEQYEQERRSQERLREMLGNGPYPGMGTGDPDLYKAFYWRFWTLVNGGGNVGVVLPRSAFVAAGSREFRETLLDEAVVTDLTFLKNRNGWVFDNVEHRYTIALLSYERTEPGPDSKLPLRGPYPDSESYESGLDAGPSYFELEEARNWTGKAAFPLLPSEPESVDAFEQLTAHPPLDRDEPGEWRARPTTEFHATNDKTTDDGERVMHFTDDPPEEFWPVLKGASIMPPDEDVWVHDTGVRYAWADPEFTVDHLHERRRSKSDHWASAFYEMPDEWVDDRETLPCLNARVAFRDVTNRTNQRTVRAALVRPNVFLTNKAPYFLWPRGDETDEAYLLGVLNSVPLDWYARRFVELNLNYHILNAFPIPRPGRDSPLRERVVEIAGRLGAKDERVADWADAVGVERGDVDRERELEMVYELDAVVAHLYGLDRESLEVVFETFHDNWDHEPRLNAVLDHYDEWAARLE